MKKPWFFYLGIFFTIAGTILIVDIYRQDCFRPNYEFQLSGGYLLAAQLAYIISIFRYERTRWPALALLIISYMAWLFIRNQLGLAAIPHCY
jgi:hypothetical protein